MPLGLLAAAACSQFVYMRVLLHSSILFIVIVDILVATFENARYRLLGKRDERTKERTKRTASQPPVAIMTAMREHVVKLC